MQFFIDSSDVLYVTDTDVKPFIQDYRSCVNACKQRQQQNGNILWKPKLEVHSGNEGFELKTY